MSLPPIAVSDLDAILAATAPLWQEMRDERLFLTGGTGFFGCWLVESFLHINRALDLKAGVTILTRDPERFLRRLPHLRGVSALRLLQGDIRDFTFPEPHRFTIHAATAASALQQAQQPLEMLSTIIRGTERVLAFAAQAGTQKLLLTSSGAVYGVQPTGLSLIPEAFAGGPDPLSRGSIYGEGKRVAEMLCGLAANERLQIKIARCFAFLGPHLPLDTHFAAGNFLGDALAGRPISIASDGRSVRSYLYASDLMIWLWTMLFFAPSLRPFNVGSQQALSVRDLAEAIRTQVAPSIAIRIGAAAGDYPPARYVPAVERARQELGLRQAVPLEEAIGRTAAWHRLKSKEANS